MKTIGIIILLMIFLAGAYLLGGHKDTAPFKRKIDSLQKVTLNQVTEIKRLKMIIDSLKKPTIAIGTKVSNSTTEKSKKKITQF